MILLPFYIDDLIKTALSEDINYIDSTADLLIPEDSVSSDETAFLRGCTAAVTAAADTRHTTPMSHWAA